MTLPLNDRVTSTYTADGTNKEFNFDFRVFFNVDTGSYGLEARKVITGGYEVLSSSLYTVVPNVDLTAGKIVFTTAPVAGTEIYLAGKTPTVQQLNLTNYGRFSAEAIEVEFDFLTAIVQEWLTSLSIETAERIENDLLVNANTAALYAQWQVWAEENVPDFAATYLTGQIANFKQEWTDALNQITLTSIPASAIPTSSGLNQQQINNLSLTPFHFGAVGDVASHKLSERYATLAEAQAIYPHAVSLDDEIDWCAIQALNNFSIASKDRSIKVNWSGEFYVNRTVSYISAVGMDDEYKTITGDIKLNVTDDFIGDDLVVLHGRGISHTGLIYADLRKKVKWGLQIASRGESGAVNHISMGNYADNLHISNAIIHAVRFTGFAMFSGFNFLRASGCGVSSAYAGDVLEASVSAHTHTDAGGLSSRSNLTVDTLPPVTPDETSILVRYGDFISRVESIDAINKKLVIKPLLPIINDPTVKIKYTFGGAVRTEGSDSAGISIRKMSTIGCGLGLDHLAMYPILIDQFISEFSGVSIYNEGLVSGVDIKQRYVEGDVYALVQNNIRSGDGCVNLDWGLNIDPSKIVDITYGRYADGTTVSTFAGSNGLRLWNNGKLYYRPYGKLPNNVVPNGVSGGFGVDFNAPFEHKIYKATGNVTVGFLPIDLNYNRLFGIDSQEFTVFGTGANGAPTGTITIPVLSGYTLNGGSTDLTFSGFTGAANFKFFLNVAAKNIQVSVSGVNTYNLSVSTQLPDDSNVNTLDVNTKLFFYSNTNATGLPLPTTGAMAEGNITTYFSLAYIGSGHRKTQVVHYPDLFENWERVYSSGSGTYGSWRLTNYQVSRGATAQRPSRPQLGMRYYDTTLLATGKPIEWNGSSWIDMAGVVV